MVQRSVAGGEWLVKNDMHADRDASNGGEPTLVGRLDQNQKDVQITAANGSRPTTRMSQGDNAAVGQLAVSKRGRDRGEPYLVLEIIDEAFVYLVNGDNRRVDNPKRKNVKHLQFYPAVAEQLALKWEAGQHVGNVEVRKVIAGLVEKWEADQLTPLAAQQKGVEE